MDSDDTALGLTQEDLKAIDTVRARLYQLTNSVQRLKADVIMSNLLPTPESIQASSFVLQQNLASLNEVMQQHAELFRRIVVHPDPMYPGRTEEQILTSLLRKKLEPDVEQVAERARETAAARGIGKASFAESLGGKRSRRHGRHGHDDDDDDNDDDDDEDDEEEEEDEEEDEDDENFDGPREPFGLGDVWYETRAWCIDRLERFIREEASDVYTKQEREMGVENVRTGLRRSLEEDDDEDDDDEDDEDEDEDEDEKTKQDAGDDDDVIMLDGGGASAAAAAPAPSTQPAQQPPPPVGPAVEPEVLLWLAARGDTDLPRYVDIESQRAAAAAAAQRRM